MRLLRGRTRPPSARTTTRPCIRRRRRWWQSLAKNHPLVDGNKRLALASLIVFLGLNDLRLTLNNDGAYGLIIAVVVDELPDVEAIAALLIVSTEPY